jgi:NADPH-dependent glutamate synthase beta subunit-like oxidoreductase
MAQLSPSRGASAPSPPWEAAARLRPAEPRLRTLANDLLRRCRGDGPPNCTAACPLRVDARRCLRLTAEGRFTEAVRVLRESSPFPGILSHVCAHPCELHCKRIDEDTGVRIRDVEQFLVAREGDPVHRIERAADCGRSVAVVGGGPAGLMAAHDLRCKGYDVTLLEEAEELGGNLIRAIPESRLPRRVVERDVALLSLLGVRVRTSTALGREVSLDELQEEFDAVVLCIGFAGVHRATADFALSRTARGTVAVAGVGRVLGRPAVFAAGDAVTGPGSVVDAMADGRRAAAAVHSYLTPAARGGEDHLGPQALRWRLEVSEEERRRRVRLPDLLEPAQPPLSAVQARAEAARCLECRCRICVDECEFLSRSCRSPQELGSRLLTDVAAAVDLVYSCTLCGLCSAVCPEGLALGGIMLEARRELVRRGLGPLPQHQPLVASYRRSIEPPLTLAVPAAGRRRSKRIFLPGCGLSSASPRAAARAYRWLREGYPDLGVALYCCGAPVLDLGMEEEFARGKEGLLRLLETVGAEEVLAACPSCTRVLREHIPEVRVAAAWVELAELTAPRPSRTGATVTIHDSCRARGDARLQEALRTLVERSGAKVVEPAHSRERTLCCGRGGGVGLLGRELGRSLGRRRVAEAGEAVVTACAGCRRVLVGGGAAAVHLVDFLADSRWLRHATRPPPRGLHVRANRAVTRLLLRRQALSERAGSEVPR